MSLFTNINCLYKLGQYNAYRAIGLLLCFSLAKAQNTPTLASLGLDFAEFNKRAILPIEVGAGFSSQQSKALFYVQVSPQFSLLAHHWRVGATIGGAYTTMPSAELPEKWVGYAGPKLSYKLLDLAGTIGGLPGHIVIGNINVFVEHLWAGSTVKLVGGGLAVDVAIGLIFFRTGSFCLIFIWVPVRVHWLLHWHLLAQWIS